MHASICVHMCVYVHEVIMGIANYILMVIHCMSVKINYLVLCYRSTTSRRFHAILSTPSKRELQFKFISQLRGIQYNQHALHTI